MNITTIPDTFAQHSRLRLLFYFDEEGNHEDILSDWPFEDINYIRVDQKFIQLKHRLLGELKEEKVFLYFPYAKPQGLAWENFPLRGLYHANRELRFDEASDFLEKHHLRESQLGLVKKYIKLLSRKECEGHLAPILSAAEFGKLPLQKGLISYALGFENYTDISTCLIKLLSWAKEEDKLQSLFRILEEWELTDLLRKWIRSYFDTDHEGLKAQDIKPLAARFKYNVLMRNIGRVVAEDHYQHLAINSQAPLNKLMSLYTSWKAHPRFSRMLDSFMTDTAQEVDEKKLMQWYGSEADFAYISPQLIGAVLDKELSRIPEEPYQVIDKLGGWRKRAEEYAHLHVGYEFAWHAAQAFNLLKNYSSYRFNSLQEYCQRYTSELYKIDLHYRKAVQLLQDENTWSIPGLAAVAKPMHQAYDRFLVELNQSWMELLNEKEFRLKQIGLPQQAQFFRREIQNFPHKSVVIISDALRYECAKELEEGLLSDKRNEARLEAMLASIPSYTALGMAQLLPHKEIAIKTSPQENSVEFLLDGKACQSLKQRSAILQSLHPENMAIHYKEVMRFNQEEGREFFKKHHVVYIYHDHIDAIGDSRKTEDGLIEAARDAQKELETLITRLHNSWNRGHVFLTADHGFLYNHLPIPEAKKEAIPTLTEKVKEHQRFVLTKPGTKKVTGFRASLDKTSPIETELEVILPRAINRFKRPGHGLKFVHGGGSLQELLVPMLYVYRKRKDKREEVSVRIIPESKQIHSGALKLTVLQEEAVGNKLKGVNIVLGLYSTANELLSEEKKLELNSSADNPRDRSQSLILRLTAQGSSASICQLRAFDSKDAQKLNPIYDQSILISSLMEKDEF